MNFFNATVNQYDKYSKEDLPVILSNIKKGIELVNSRMSETLIRVRNKKDYIKVELPVQWA